MVQFRGTTICAVSRNGETAIAGDGQVTMGESVVMKNNAKKVRRVYDGKVVIGFAGSVSDAFALSEKFEDKLTMYSGNLLRAAVELVQDWRQNKTAKLEAMMLALQGEDIDIPEGSVGEAKEGAAFSDFNTEDITFTYCTEFIIQRENDKDPESLRAFLDSLGDSLVLVDDEEIIKVHVHTNDPGKALHEAIDYGSFVTVKIENMRLQHTEKVMNENEKAPKIAAPEKPIGVVSVCAGDGLADVFQNLGTDGIISGGQTMNPSTQDILTAVNAVPAETVFVLPNNKNIIMVANQAAKIIAKEHAEGEEPAQRVIVLETRSVPEGMSAMLAFDETSSADDNAAAMTETFGCVHTLSVTRAVKDAAIDGISIKAGEYMGLCDRKIGYTGTDYEIIILEMLRNFPDASFVTVLYGDEVTEENANIIFEKMKAEMPDAEFSLLYGGQPLYDFVISVE